VISFDAFVVTIVYTVFALPRDHLCAFRLPARRGSSMRHAFRLLGLGARTALHRLTADGTASGPSGSGWWGKLPTVPDFLLFAFFFEFGRHGVPLHILLVEGPSMEPTLKSGDRLLVVDFNTFMTLSQCYHCYYRTFQWWRGGRLLGNRSASVDDGKRERLEDTLLRKIVISKPQAGSPQFCKRLVRFLPELVDPVPSRRICNDAEDAVESQQVATHASQLEASDMGVSTTVPGTTRCDAAEGRSAAGGAGGDGSVINAVADSERSSVASSLPRASTTAGSLPNRAVYRSVDDLVAPKTCLVDARRDEDGTPLVWLLGDNLSDSLDSRNFGALPMSTLQGVVLARWSTRRGENWGLRSMLREPSD
jgi:hypothetical protein